MNNIKDAIDKFIISKDDSIREAIRKMDIGGIGFITCVDKEENVVGVVTDGDFRRGILNGIPLNKNIELIANDTFISANQTINYDEAKEIFNNSAIKHIPIIENGKLTDIITEEFVFGFIKPNKYKMIDLPVVIMAGGKGSRLDPFTRILPKPLIPIGNKPVIEYIMDEYAKFGMNSFYISINHKGKMIKAYFEDHEGNYNFQYINEEKPLGTAGALKHLEGIIDTPFFVSNCDIIIKDDYTKFYDFHKKGNYALTMVASMQHHTIPYGVCTIENGGKLKSIEEKPEYDILVNTGLYILNPDVLKYIPENEFFHITNLIDILKKEGYKVGVYPVSEKSWIDIGQWEEYKKSFQRLSNHV